MACSSVKLGWVQQNQYMKSPGWIVGLTSWVRAAAALKRSISSVKVPTRRRRKIRFKTFRGPDFSPLRDQTPDSVISRRRCRHVEFGILHTSLSSVTTRSDRGMFLPTIPSAAA